MSGRKLITCLLAFLTLVPLLAAPASLAQQENRRAAAFGIEVRQGRKAMPGVEVRLESEGPVRGTSPEPRVTDAEGRAEFWWLTPGIWRVDLLVDGEVAYFLTVRIDPGRRAEEMGSPARDVDAPDLRWKFFRPKGEPPPPPPPPSRAEPEPQPEPPAPEPAAPEPAALEPAAPEPAAPEAAEPEAAEPEPVAPEPVAAEPQPAEPQAAEPLAEPAPEPVSPQPEAAEPEPMQPSAEVTPAPEPTPEPATPEPATPEPVSPGSESPEPVMEEPEAADPAAPDPAGESSVESVTPPPMIPDPTLPPTEDPTDEEPELAVDPQAAQPEPGPEEESTPPPMIQVPAPLPGGDAAAKEPAATQPPAPEAAPEAMPEPMVEPTPEPTAEAAPAPVPQPAAPVEDAAEDLPVPPEAEPEPVAAAPVEPAPMAGPRFTSGSGAGGDCPECKASESSVTLERTVPPGNPGGGATCGPDMARAALDAARRLASRGEGLGPGMPLDGGELSRYTGSGASCQVLGVVLPAGVRYRGYTYSVETGGDAGGPCYLPRACPVAGAIWTARPVIEEVGNGARMVYGVFRNASAVALRAKLQLFYVEE